MVDNIYISTNVFGQRGLKDIISLALESKIINLELGSGIDYAEDNMGLVKKFNKKPFNFLIHNYFPTPKNGFVLNLASNDKDILAKSMRLCKLAVDLSAVLKAPFYSVHSGFAFHAMPKDMNKPQTGLARIPYKEAYDIFVKSIKRLADYGFNKGVKIAVENNVVSEFNLIDGKNKLLLLADCDEALSFYKEVGSKNLFFLVDLGHLKINSNLLNFDGVEYIKKIKPLIVAFHISDNNARVDSHLKFRKNAWFRDIIFNDRDKTFIIEADKLKTEEMFDTYSNLKYLLGRRDCGDPRAKK